VRSNWSNSCWPPNRPPVEAVQVGVLFEKNTSRSKTQITTIARELTALCLCVCVWGGGELISIGLIRISRWPGGVINVIGVTTIDGCGSSIGKFVVIIVIDGGVVALRL